MMSFFRTPDGIANQPLFTQVKFIIYVEEDPNLDPARSVDSSFWRGIFERFFGLNYVETKPLGGKRHVKEMAERIIGHSIPNSFCAMDRDYDDLFGEKIDDERVFYTHGYGVENDVLSEHHISTLITRMVPGAQLSQNNLASVWSSISETLRKERYTLYSDQIAARRKRATLDREVPTKCIDFNHGGLPIRFRRKPIKSKMRIARTAEIVRTEIGHLSYSYDCVPAHLYFEIVYHSVCRFLSAFTNSSFNKDQFRLLALSVSHECLRPTAVCVVAEHYRTYALRNLSKYSSLLTT
jgi:hypothetical protein